MRKLAACAVLALLVAMMPLTVVAQAELLDEERRATVVMLAQETAAAVNSAVATTPGREVSDEAGDAAPSPQFAEPAPEPTSEPADEPEDEPEDEPVALPELNLTDLVEYSSQGVTLQAPADWNVETDFDEGMPFIIEVPGTEVFMSVESDTELTFPSWLGLALFRSQADLLVDSMGVDAHAVESATLHTDQNLPVTKLEFSGMDNGEAVAGVLYATAPNNDAYLIIGGGPTAEWEYAAPGVELIVESIVFDQELIIVEQAGDEPLLFDDEDAGVEVTVPAGWYVMGTDDPQFPVIAAEPEARYVAAIGTEDSFGGDFDPEILEVFVPDADDLDPSEYEELIDTIAEAVVSSGSPLFVDEAASTVTTREGAVTVKLVGDAEVDVGLTMPIIFYIDLRQSGAGVVAVFGDTESALEVEAEILAMLESVAGLE